MLSERFVRNSLWASVPLNFSAAAILLMPWLPPGRLLGLSPNVNPIYAGIASYMIAFFGCTYIWLARAKTIDGPLLWAGALGKIGFVLLGVALWLAGVANGAVPALASVDLVFAMIWLAWLRG
jgi:hypothetical protein